MPKWGMSMTSGKVIEWIAAEGDHLQKGDEVVEIETEKSLNVLEANCEGLLVRRVAAEGDELPVGALLGVLAAPGSPTDPETIDTFVAEFNASFVPETVEGEDTVTGPRRLTVDGISIAHRYHPGSGPPGASPVVLLHGFGGDQEGWQFNIGDMAMDRPVRTLDLPGHGLSARVVGDGSIGYLTGVVSDWLDEVEPGPVHLVGHSLGAALAVELASRREFLSLTLIAGLGPGTAVDEEYVEGFITAERRRQLRPYLLRLFADPRLVTRDMVEAVLRAKRIESTPEALRRIATASILGVDTDPVERLHSLTTPVQVIWGGRDDIAPSSQVDGIPPSVRVELIAEAGHMVHVEAASKVNRLVRGMAAGHP